MFLPFFQSASTLQVHTSITDAASKHWRQLVLDRYSNVRLLVEDTTARATLLLPLPLKPNRTALLACLRHRQLPSQLFLLLADLATLSSSANMSLHCRRLITTKKEKKNHNVRRDQRTPAHPVLTAILTRFGTPHGPRTELNSRQKIPYHSVLLHVHAPADQLYPVAPVEYRNVTRQSGSPTSIEITKTRYRSISTRQQGRPGNVTRHKIQACGERLTRSQTTAAPKRANGLSKKSNSPTKQPSTAQRGERKQQAHATSPLITRCIPTATTHWPAKHEHPTHQRYNLGLCTHSKYCTSTSLYPGKTRKQDYLRMHVPRPRGPLLAACCLLLALCLCSSFTDVACPGIGLAIGPVWHPALDHHAVYTDSQNAHGPPPTSEIALEAACGSLFGSSSQTYQNGNCKKQRLGGCL